MSRPRTVYEPPALARINPLAALARLRQFSDLFLTLSLHRINVRYKQSRLGIVWAVLQPLAMMLVFTLMFTFMRVAPSERVPFPLFAYSALIPWTMFSSGLMAASMALTSHASLLTKVYFPREILPLSYIVAALVDFGLASLVLVVLMMWFGVAIAPTVAWAAVAIAILLAWLIGLALLLAALQVRYRDVGLAMPVLMQVWLFASPVLYPLAAVRRALPAPLYTLYTMNPIAGVVDTFRRALVLHEAPDLDALIMAAAIAAVLLPAAYIYFKYVELTMADLV
ncbi:MAG TPA: ABC transporter permease [Vicinamibacterales bacterium]|nr:ABC transporter permease [Vicinamibacterales bacterium]